MRLAIVDLGLSSREADIFTIIRQLNTHFLTDFLEDLSSFLQFQGIAVPDGEHCIFMSLLSANSHCAAIRPCTNHFQSEIGIMAMHTNKNARLNFIAPNREIRMIRIDHLFRINLRILGAIVRHRNDHDVRDLRRNL